MANPYAPPGETPSDLWLERSNLVGAVLAGVAYGVHLTVFAECSSTIYSNARSRRIPRTHSWWLFSFVFILFAMGTLNVACNTLTAQLMFIDNRNYPGGPNAYLENNYNCGCGGGGNASYIIANFFADGALLWRVYVAWGSWWMVIFPLLVYLASTAMSVLALFQSSRPNANFWTKTAVQFSVPYFSISIALNVILTLLLVGRLLYFVYITKKGLLGKDHAKPYTSIAAMLVESAAPYTITGLVFIISYARNSNVQNLVLPVLGQIMCISPEIIILRVATGRSVTSMTKHNTGSVVETLQFRQYTGTDYPSRTTTSLGVSCLTEQTSSVTIGGSSQPDLLPESAHRDRGAA